MALHYQELIGWQKSISLVTDLYRSTQKFPREEIYGLTTQIRRAAVSIPSNIAEGQGRMSRGEFKQFLGYARGSIFELESQLTIAENLGYLTNEDAAVLIDRTRELGRIVTGLIKSLESARQPKPPIETSD